MDFSQKMRRGWLFKDSIAFVCVVVSLCCMLVVIISMLRLPEIQSSNKAIGSYRTMKIRKVFKEDKLGRFGEMMVEMLPEDLAFTVFIPSEKAFDRDLRLRVNESLVAEKMNDTYALLSRILGFSAVPRTISSVAVPFDKEISFDSLSGFVLFISKDLDGMLVVNRVRSQWVDLRRKEIVVHIMDGVIMDAEFEQSVQPEEDLTETN